MIPPHWILIEWSRQVNETLWFWALLGISVMFISDPATWILNEWSRKVNERLWFWALLGISFILISDPAPLNSDSVVPPGQWEVMVLGPFRDICYIYQWSRHVNSDWVIPKGQWEVVVLSPFRDIGYINQRSRPIEFWLSGPARSMRGYGFGPF